MTDPIELIGQLSLERKDLDAQIAKLTARRSEIDARIREVATLLVAPAPAPAPARAAAQQVLELVEGSGLQLKQRQLLGYLREHRGEHTNFFAQKMYGRADFAKNRSVTAYFSRLKAGGYVTPIGPGRFAITEKGIRAAIVP